MRYLGPDTNVQGFVKVPTLCPGFQTWDLSVHVAPKSSPSSCQQPPLRKGCPFLLTGSFPGGKARAHCHYPQVWAGLLVHRRLGWPLPPSCNSWEWQPLGHPTMLCPMVPPS